MNISLTRELEKFIQQKVAGGMYHSASEVVREALRLLRERDEIRTVHVEQLRDDIAIGLRDLDRGRSRSFDPGRIRKRIDRESAQTRRASQRRKSA